jgi:hypothetical protein
MRLRPILSLLVLMAGILISGPAWGRPCCTDCDSWPNLDPTNDPCARVCLFSCFAPQAPHAPRADRVLLQEIFSAPETAGDPNSGSDTGDEEVPVVVPRPEAKVGGPVPSWCTNRNNNYCTYAWDWMNRCCNPSYIAPGAYCPGICE